MKTADKNKMTLEEMKKEFEEKFLRTPDFDYHIILDQQDSDEVWDWIETKIDEACKKAKIEENVRWELMAENDEIDCHPSFFKTRISELWENHHHQRRVSNEYRR